MQNTIQLTPQESKPQVQRDWLAEGVPVAQMFQNEEFGAIEVMVIDGKPHFPATECVEVWGYATPRHTVSRHCTGGTKRAVIESLGQTQQKTYIPEGDLCRLIIRSKLAAAIRFESWICDTVIPSIRQHGA